MTYPDEEPDSDTDKDTDEEPDSDTDEDTDEEPNSDTDEFAFASCSRCNSLGYARKMGDPNEVRFWTCCDCTKRCCFRPSSNMLPCECQWSQAG